MTCHLRPRYPHAEVVKSGDRGVYKEAVNETALLGYSFSAGLRDHKA